MAGDTIIQAQSTLFERSGETIQFRNYSLPGALIGQLTNEYLTAPFFTNYNAEQSALFNLLTQNSEIIPGGLTLFNIQSLLDGVFDGSIQLADIWAQDPFSTTYETSTTALYTRTFQIARTLAQSGPTNVRGGTARQGFELAELSTQQSINRFREIWQNQLALAQIVVNAINVHNQIEAGRRRDKLQAQQQQAATEQGRVMQTLSAAEQLDRDRATHVRTMSAGGEYLGAPGMVTTETLAGQGMQGAVTTGFGMSTWR